MVVREKERSTNWTGKKKMEEKLRRKERKKEKKVKRK